MTSSLIYDVKVDKNGVVWIATFGGGICRYDGKSFKNINQDNGLPSDLIRTIAIDEKNNGIYVGAQGSLSFISKDSIYNLTHLLDTKNANVVFLSLQKDGRLIVGGSFKMTSIVNNGESITRKDLINVCGYEVDTEGNQWFVCKNNIVIKTKKGEDISLNETQVFEPKNLTDIKKFNNQYLVSSAQGIFVFENLKLVKKITKNKSFTNDNVRCLFVDKNNTLWIGTTTGLFYTKDLNVFYKLDEKNGIEPSVIKIITADNNGDLWVGTNGNSIFKQINSNILKYPVNEKIEDLFLDRKNSLYALTKAEILKFEKDSNKFVSVKNIKNFSQYNPIAFCYDDIGNLYLANTSKGIAKVSKNNSYEWLPLHYKIEKNEPLCMIYADSIVWVSFRKSILKYNTNTKVAEEVRTMKSFETDDTTQRRLPSKTIHSWYHQNIYKDKNKNIWITTGSGVSKLSNNLYHEYSSVTMKNFPEGMTEHVTSDKYNHTWVTTQSKGLVCIENNNIFFNSRKNGFLTNEIFGITTLDTLLFASSNRGLIQLNIKKSKNRDNDYFLINEKYGLLPSNLSNSEMLSDSQSVWIASSISPQVFRYTPLLTEKQTDKINVFITDVFKDSVSFVFRNSKNYTKSFVDLSSPLLLKHNENGFVISFIGINHRQVENTLYRYRLRGLTDKWSIPSEETKAVFTNLNPGKYIFELSVLKSNTSYKTPISLVIVISPPFYKTIWFLLLCIVTGIIFIYIFIQLRLKSVKKQNVLLENKVSERTIELNKKTEELIENNHLLFEKNRLIFESLEYSKKIQESILPSLDYVEQLFSGIIKTAVLYLPKDIVSGDFYYVNKKHGFNYFAVVDCTGHGVPGALLSFSVNSILHGVIDNSKVKKMPSEILNKVSEEFADLYTKGQDVKESFAVSLIAYDSKSGQLYFSSISQSIIVADNNKVLSEIKNETSFLQKDKLVFTDKTVNVVAGNRVFLFSDGYYDQKGITNNKRLLKSGLIKLIQETLHLSISEQILEIEQFFKLYKGSLEQMDDATILILEIC